MLDASDASPRQVLVGMLPRDRSAAAIANMGKRRDAGHLDQPSVPRAAVSSRTDDVSQHPA